MFPDHDNPSTAAAAAPAQDAESEKAKAANDGHASSSGASEVVAEVNAAREDATSAPVPQADGDSRPEAAATPAAPAGAQESHAKEAAAPVDAEAAAASAQGPVEVGLVLRVTRPELRVRRHDRRGDQVVAGETPASRHHADAPTEGEPGDPDGRAAPAGESAGNGVVERDYRSKGGRVHRTGRGC